MAQFIRLTLNTGRTVYVNMGLVRDIYQKDYDGTTNISFDNDYYYVVKETPQQIFEKIETGETNLNSIEYTNNESQHESISN